MRVVSRLALKPAVAVSLKSLSTIHLLMLCASQQVICVCHTLNPRLNDAAAAKAVSAAAASRRHQQARKVVAGRTEAGVLLDGDLLASYALLPAPRQAEVARRAGVSREAALQALHAAAAATALF